MGCTPSHSSKLQNITKNSFGSFRKGKTLNHQTDRSDSLTGTQSEDGGASSSHSETDSETWQRKSGCSLVEGVSHPSQSNLSFDGSECKPLSAVRGSLEQVCTNKVGVQEININMTQEKEEDKIKYETQKGKERSSVHEQKVDFPELLVKAHQSAYAYLNPSISKYETLLDLLDQAARTHFQLQQMVSFLALCYEQLNQVLEEITGDGEKLLKEYGEHLSWPIEKWATQQKHPPPDLLQQLLQYTIQRMQSVGKAVGEVSDSALADITDYFESASDLMAEKLRVKRMLEDRLCKVLVWIDTSAIRKPGPEDMALYSEDSGIGVESESLGGSEKPTQHRNSCESAKLNSSETTQEAGSLSLQKSKPPKGKKIHSSVSLNSLDSNGHTASVETESLFSMASMDEDDDNYEDDLDDEDGLDEKNIKECSHSTPASPSFLSRPAQKWIENPENVEMTLKMKHAISGRIRFLPEQNLSSRSVMGSRYTTQWKEEEEEEEKTRRPQTASASTTGKKSKATKQRRTRSAESLRSQEEDPTLLELQRTQKDLSRRLEKMSEGKTEHVKLTKPKMGREQTLLNTTANNRLRSSLAKNFSILPSQDKPILQKAGSKEMTEQEKRKEKKPSKGPFKATPPIPVASQHGRQSVKKLIDTFSQGKEMGNNLIPLKPLAPLKGIRKCGVLVFPSVGCHEFSSINRTENNNKLVTMRTDSKADDVDFDSFPPPPPEVLMDNSFQVSEELQKTTDGSPSSLSNCTTRRNLLNQQKATFSDRLRASLTSVNVLPSKGTLCRGSVKISPQKCMNQDSSSRRSSLDSQGDTEPETENEETASLYRQARKIIHLRHSTESPTNVPDSSEPSNKKEEDTPFSGSEKPLIYQDNISTAATEKLPRPPRGPPDNIIQSSLAQQKHSSTPLSPTAVQRKLPSPPVIHRQPASSSASPPMSRKLPSPPTTRKLPSPPQQRKLPHTPSQLSNQGAVKTKSASPPTMRREVNPSSFCKTPSPPTSPRASCKKVYQARNIKDLGEDTSRVIGNAHSIFCPVTSSMFQAQPPTQASQAWSIPNTSILPRPWGDQARNRNTLGTVTQSPQPFIRRSYSDRRPVVQLKLPQYSASSITSGSEPTISTQG
uniref:Photoreceptor cilium actin regulator n=1 Tax=Erpetoichthys calabaricus TaxID=27687 RepID=A0A8C4RH39_ERPCA